MVPTLPGRIQTRIFLLATVGSIVTALLTPLLSLPGPLSAAYRTTYIILASVLVAGIGWELLYHLLMQWRWEKDWPSLFGLVTGVPEAILIWILLAVHAVPGISTTPPLSAYLIRTPPIVRERTSGIVVVGMRTPRSAGALQGGGEEVREQLVDPLGLVVMDPVRGVRQALDAIEVGHIVVVGLG